MRVAGIMSGTSLDGIDVAIVDIHGRRIETIGFQTSPYPGRLRERLIEAGAENLPDYELLEMLLFAANPQGDVKPTAKALLAQFGGFGKVMSADPQALSEAGLGLAGVAAIKAVREAALRLMRVELQEQPIVNTWDKLIDYCNAQVAHNKVEEFHILFLDRKNVLIKH